MRSATSAASTRVFTNTHAAPSYPARGLCCERTVEEIAEHLPLTFELLDPEAAEQKPMTVTFSQLMDELLLPLRGRMPFHPRPFQSRVRHAGCDGRHGAHRCRMDEGPLDAGMRRRLGERGQGAPAQSPRRILDAIYQYIIYRQLDLASPEDLEQFAVPVSVLARFAAESTLFIYLEAVRTGDPFRAVSRWSEQIEYDTDNWRDQIEELTSHFLISNH